MSDRPDLEQVRARVMQAAREIERLCLSRPGPRKLFPPFVRLAGGTVGAAAGSVWFLDERGQAVKVTDSGVDALGFERDATWKTWRSQLVSNALATGESALERAPARGASASNDGNGAVPRVAAESSADARRVGNVADAASVGNGSVAPTLAVVPLHSGKRCVGVVEFAFQGELAAEARVSTMQFLEQMCGHASRSLDGPAEEGGSAAWATFLEEFESLCLRLHRGLDPAMIAVVAVNDGRALLGCQRVSLAITRGRKLKVTAISGQEGVNRKSNLVRAMTGLIAKVSATREPMFFSAQPESVLPSLAGPLTGYLEENGTQVVAVIPLMDHPPRRSDDEDVPGVERRETPRRVIGCLVVDGPVDGKISARSRDALGLLADHVAAAMANAMTYRRLFLLPLWRFLGDKWDRARGGTLLTVVVAAVLLAAAVGALILVPWEYRVPADGRLMPVVQRQVFAPWDGEVVEIGARDGQRVKAGDVLLTLRGSDLQMQILTTRNELNQKQETALALQAQIDEATKKADRDEETRLQGQLGATRVEIEGLEKQLQSWEDRRRELVVRAPIEGVVATFRVEQLLLNRPVRRGDVLLEVMEDEGSWRLEVDVPEHRMGHVLRARRDLSPDRPVEFVLATAPETTFFGKLETVGTRTTATDQQGSVVQAHVRIEASLLPARNIGAEVKARIECGRRSLGYVLFGDFIEWLRKTLWL